MSEEIVKEPKKEKPELKMPIKLQLRWSTMRPIKGRKADEVSIRAVTQ